MAADSLRAADLPFRALYDRGEWVEAGFPVRPVPALWGYADYAAKCIPEPCGV
jgi:hypothetical protein